MEARVHSFKHRNRPMCLLLRRTGVAVAALLFCLSAAAEVTLTTRVQRVVEPPPGQSGPVSLEDVTEVLPGERLRYTIIYTNTSNQDVAAESVVITNPLPPGVEYLEGSAQGEGCEITYSIDGENFAVPDLLVVGEGETARTARPADYRAIRWSCPEPLPAGESGEVSFDVRMLADPAPAATPPAEGSPARSDP